MDKVMLYEEDMELRPCIEEELMKYSGQFDLVVVSSFQKARELIHQKAISICVVGVDMENQEHAKFISEISNHYMQVPFILMHKKSHLLETDREDRFNILKEIIKPFDVCLIPNAIMEGLDAIDEGMLWRRMRSFRRA